MNQVTAGIKLRRTPIAHIGVFPTKNNRQISQISTAPIACHWLDVLKVAFPPLGLIQDTPTDREWVRKSFVHPGGEQKQVPVRLGQRDFVGNSANNRNG